MAWPPSVSRTVVCPARSKSNKTLMVSSFACRKGSFDDPSSRTIGPPWTELMSGEIRQTKEKIQRERIDEGFQDLFGAGVVLRRMGTGACRNFRECGAGRRAQRYFRHLPGHQRHGFGGSSKDGGGGFQRRG